jgi:ATP-dependent RNA helicase DeaD
MPPEVSRIAGTYMNDPVTLTMGEKNAAADGVEHYHFPVHVHEKYAALKRLVDYHPEMYGIVFCRTKASTQEIADRLVSDGYDVESLHGDLSQAQREQVMKKFRRRNLQLIVATDIAARGLDVQDLSHVIHYDLPDEIDIYTHRSGRTGRAGKSGISYAIVGPRERRRLQQIERIIKKKIPKGTMPGGEDIFQRQLMEFADRLAATEVNESQLAPYSAAMQEKFEDLSREELIQKMVAMQFDKMIDYYHGLPDMTPLREDSSRGKERRDYGKKERAGSFRGKAPGKDRGKDRGRGGVEDGYMSISVNLGANDNVAPPDLIGLVNQSSKRRGIEIGRIKIHASRSTMQVEEDAAHSTAQALNGFTYRGRTVKAEITEAPRGGKNDRRGKNGSSRDSGRSSGGAKKSGKVLYAGKLLDD